MKESAKWDYLGNVPNHREHYRSQYGILANVYKEQTKSALLKMVPMRGKTTLEVCCGSGFVGEIAKEMGITITYGVDFTKSLLKHAKGKYGKVMYADVTKKLPFKNECIDVVLLPEVISHITDRKKALKEIHRVLKIGGYMIVESPNRAYLDFLNTMKLLLKGHSLRKSQQFFQPLYFGELTVLVKDCGFKIINHYRTFHMSRQVMLAEKVRK